MIKDELKQIVKRRDEILETVVRDREMPYAKLDTFFLNNCSALFAMMNVMIDALEWYANDARYLVSHLPNNRTDYRGTEIELDKGERAREALKGFE